MVSQSTSKFPERFDRSASAVALIPLHAYAAKHDRQDGAPLPAEPPDGITCVEVAPNRSLTGTMRVLKRILTVSLRDEAAGIVHETLRYRGSGLAIARTHDAPDPGDTLGRGAKTRFVTKTEAMQWMIDATVRLMTEGGVWEIGGGFVRWLIEVGRMAGMLREPVPESPETRPAARNVGVGRG